jgi:hypothetical protein
MYAVSVGLLTLQVGIAAGCAAKVKHLALYTGRHSLVFQEVDAALRVPNHLGVLKAIPSL